MIAFYLAFKTLGGEHTPADDKSYSNDHYELESSNPPDTVLVATFLENKFTSNENIKKQYIYGCKFTDKLAGKEVFLLFSIFWDPVFRCWRRLPNDCCCGASSLEEATDWMLERTFKRTFNIKGNFADYFKKWKLDIKIGKGAGSKNPLEIKELRRFLIICLYVLCLVSVFSGGGVPWVFHYIVPITIGPIIFLPYYYLKKYGYMVWIHRLLIAFFGPFFTLHYIFFKFFGGTEYLILKFSISGIISLITFIYLEKIVFYFDSIFDLNYNPLVKKSRNRIFFGLFDKLKFNLKQFNTISNADELKKYAELRDQGVISEDEFQAKKRQLLDL